MLQYIPFNLSRNNDYIRSLVDLGDDKFTFIIRWNEYCDCFFMDIQDLDGNYLLSGRALVNGLIVRHHDLPFGMVFLQLQGKTYEPTIDNINEFGLVYEVEEEE